MAGATIWASSGLRPRARDPHQRRILHLYLLRAANHYEDNILRIERFVPEGMVGCGVRRRSGLSLPQRFTFEPSARKQRITGENPDSTLILLSDAPGARYRVDFTMPEGAPVGREPLQVVASEFIAVKSFQSQGKRLTNFPTTISRRSSLSRSSTISTPTQGRLLPLTTPTPP